MKRFLMRLVFAVAFVVLPTVVNAAPTGTPNLSVADAFEVQIVFGADTDDSEALPTGASCSVGVAHSGTGTVRLYQIATATTAAASGTQVGTDFTASTTTPTKFKPGLPFLKAVASAASDGTVMTIRCSNLEVAGGGGADPYALDDLPTTASVGDQATVTDCSTAPACTVGGGTAAATVKVWDGDSWDSIAVAGAGSVATDAIWAAAGDIVIGLANDIGAALTIGSAAQVLVVSGGIPA